MKAFDNWVADGSCSVVQNANKKVIEYLAKGVKNPLKENKTCTLNEIIKKFIENH